MMRQTIPGRCRFDEDGPVSLGDLVTLMARWERLSNGYSLLIPEARCVVSIRLKNPTQPPEAQADASRTQDAGGDDGRG